MIFVEKYYVDEIALKNERETSIVVFFLFIDLHEN